MKILFIDTESFPSHINFNRIHINKLISEGHDVFGIFRAGYFEDLGINSLRLIHQIPDKYYEKGKDTRIKGRFLYLRRLLNIRKFINLKKYDVIISSYYDETVFPFAFLRNGMYLINHVNVGGLDCKIKRLLYKYISRNNHQIVLTKDSWQYLNSIGIKSFYVNHGIPDTFDNRLPRPNYLKQKYTIFSPSATSSDNEFIEKLISTPQFISFLENNNIQFIIKSRNISSSNNIKIIDYYMSEEEYQKCFIHADIILIAYKPSFKYRASGILWECIANGKQVMIRDIPGLSEYKDIFDENNFFKYSDELVIKISRLIEKGTKQPEYDKSRLSPDYKFLNK